MKNYLIFMQNLSFKYYTYKDMNKIFIILYNFSKIINNIRSFLYYLLKELIFESLIIKYKEYRVSPALYIPYLNLKYCILKYLI